MGQKFRAADATFHKIVKITHMTNAATISNLYFVNGDAAILFSIRYIILSILETSDAPSSGMKVALPIVSLT